MNHEAWDPGVFVTFSESETMDLARRFGQTLDRPCFVLLCGDLGTGKTVFVRGLATGLGVRDPGLVRSPSFTLVNQYYGRLPIYHIDLYRLETLRDLETIGMSDIGAEEAIVVVEWADKMRMAAAPGWRVEISDCGGEKRELSFLSLPKVEGLKVESRTSNV